MKDGKLRLVFASDSFKGSLDSAQTIGLLTRAARDVFGDCELVGTPVADGGEGTMEAVVQACHGEVIERTVKGPLFEPVSARYGRIDRDRAVLEMAQASGLPLVSKENRNPLYTTTYGTGELIADALNRGFTDISIAIGGSATNDGGIGCMRALGVRFFDENDKELAGIGADLEKICRIDVSGLHPRVSDAKFTVMCDVTNPLCGPDGATHTFGPQKGATPPIEERLEAGMENYRKRLMEQFGVDANDIPGSGAAGGLGAALLVFLHARLKSGIDAVLDLIGFDDLLCEADLVVTGEGRTDWQSCFGKVLHGVGKRCQKRGIPAVALSGGMGKGAEDIMEHGIESIMTTVNGVMDIEEAMEHAEALYYGGAVRLFRLIRVGMDII